MGSVGKCSARVCGSFSSGHRSVSNLAPFTDTPSLAHLTVLDLFRGPSLILLISLRWLAKLGFFLQGAACTFEQDISETSSHPHGLSWLPMHVHPLALEDAMPGARADLSKDLPCCQCGNQTSHLGLEVIKQKPSFPLKQILLAEDLGLSGETSRLCEQLLGKAKCFCGWKQSRWVLFNISNHLSQPSLFLAKVSKLCAPMLRRPAFQSLWELEGKCRASGLGPLPLNHWAALLASVLSIAWLQKPLFKKSFRN